MNLLMSVGERDDVQSRGMLSTGPPPAPSFQCALRQVSPVRRPRALAATAALADLTAAATDFSASFAAVSAALPDRCALMAAHAVRAMNTRVAVSTWCALYGPSQSSI